MEMALPKIRDVQPEQEIFCFKGRVIRRREKEPHLSRAAVQRVKNNSAGSTTFHARQLQDEFDERR